MSSITMHALHNHCVHSSLTNVKRAPFSAECKYFGNSILFANARLREQNVGRPYHGSDSSSHHRSASHHSHLGHRHQTRSVPASAYTDADSYLKTEQQQKQNKGSNGRPLPDSAAQKEEDPGTPMINVLYAWGHAALRYCTSKRSCCGYSARDPR